MIVQNIMPSGTNEINEMDHQPNVPTGNPIASALLTIFLFFVYKWTLSEWAGAATIVAGASTFLLNVYKYYQLKNKK